jgi:hypothetical protein
LDAALARARWLPGISLENRYELMSAYQLLLLVPLVLYDVMKMGRVHRASTVGIGLFAVWAIVANVLWGSAWWHETASRLVGFSS